MTKSNYEVAHDWGRWCLDPSKRNRGSNRNVSWEGNIFWSRATPIAVCWRGPDDKPFVLVTATKYSPSTGGQISHLTSALTGLGMPMFRVPFIGVTGGWSAEPRDTNLKAALHAGTVSWHSDIHDYADRQVKSWKNPWHDWQTYLHTMYAGLERWHNVTGAARVEPINIDELVLVTEQRIAVKRSEYFHPKAVERRERAAARRMALKALSLR